MEAPHNYSLSSLASSAVEDRTFPIHCIVEQEDEAAPDYTTMTTRVVCDMYVVLPGSTLFCDVIRAALAQLSFPSADVMTATGSIQFRNWKPLPFSAVTDDQNSTVEQIFSDVFSASTIRIRLSKYMYNRAPINQQFSQPTSMGPQKINKQKSRSRGPQTGNSQPGPTHGPEEGVERRIGVWTDEKVRAAIVRLLRNHTQSELAAVSPLSQPTISNIANSRYRASISDETCRAFGEWYDTFRLQKQDGDGFRSSGAKQRLTYHPIYELPLMREWFQMCPNPTREDLIRFTDQLNSTPTRKERVLVSPSRLRIWWINEKQRMRRCTDPSVIGRGSGRKRLQRKWVEPAEQNGQSSTETSEMIDVGHADAQRSFTLLH